MKITFPWHSNILNTLKVTQATYLIEATSITCLCSQLKMSSKEVKNLLKEAREAIKNKEYQLAIRKCKVRDINYLPAEIN